MKFLFFIAILFSAAHSFAQKNLKYTPEHPQAGEPITITYTPANDLMGTKATVEGVVYTSGKGTNAQDILLKKSGNAYVGTIQTDTADNFVFFGFSAEGNFDKANNEGFWIQLYDGSKVKKGANLSLSMFYSSYGRSVGLDANADKSLKAMEEEFKLYPELKSDNLVAYLRTLSQVKKEEAPSILQKEIEDFVKKGLKDEDSYATLRSLYSLAKLPAQANFINTVLKEKFTDGKWTINDAAQKYMAEKDLTKKESMLDEMLSNIKMNPDWKSLELSVPFFISNLANAYVAKKDFDGLKSVIQKYDIKGQPLAQLYNSVAWNLQEKDEDLKLADEFSEKATTWAKNEWKKPTGEKPAMQNERAWEKSRARTYSMYADTYAMVQYKLGNYKKGFPYTEEAALKLGKGESADQNNTYALLASKVLSPKKYVPQLEKFVVNGKATSQIKDLLKEAYIKKNNAAGFDDYLAKLERANYLKMVEDLKKSMLNNAAPQFTLLDLDGKKVSLSDLKNKVVIVDFWATWCGPCIASFPGMQKMVTKYKDDPEVKFVFVDTWENGNNKEKAAAAFMSENKYDFHVLMDNDNKVVESFKVEGIPTKFVIDKKGNTRFKSVGYSGSDDSLMSELTAMIDLVKGE
ncbi:MAG: TlpA disulfide reductase family protein [Ginsengibacter sp.]